MAYRWYHISVAQNDSAADKCGCECESIRNYSQTYTGDAPESSYDVRRSTPADNIWAAMVIVWRIKRGLSELFSAVYYVPQLCSHECIHASSSYKLTLSSPVVSNGYTSKCSGPYCSNPPFFMFWHSCTLALRTDVPKWPNVKKWMRLG